MNPAQPDPNASCSEDQVNARRLSRSLRSAVSASPPEALPYTRLGAPSAAPEAAAAAAPSPAPAPPSRPPRPSPPPTHVGAEGWNRLLEDYAQYTGSREIFIVDASGLAVASLGIPGDWDLERIGSRLSLAFDQADQMSSRWCRHIAIDLGSRILTGIRLTDPDGGTLTLGVLADAPLDPSLIGGMTNR